MSDNNSNSSGGIGFGLAHIRAEGCPIHPDDMNMGATSKEGYKKWRKKQLVAYFDWRIERGAPKDCIENEMGYEEYLMYKDEEEPFIPDWERDA